jgi:virginiamycin A acetyltransferase
MGNAETGPRGRFSLSWAQWSKNPVPSSSSMKQCLRGCIRKLLPAREKKDSNVRGSVVTHPELIHASASVLKSRLLGPVTVKEGVLIDHAFLMGNVSVGRYTAINGPGTDVHSAHNSISIGSFSSIAMNVCIQEFNHRVRGCTTSFIRGRVFGEEWQEDAESKGGITIGNDVWIGTQCAILAGAVIDDGAVIGANSVVTSHIPSYAIAFGSPARVVGYRFPDPMSARLLKIKWWDWSRETILSNKPLFVGDLTEEKLDRIVLPDDPGSSENQQL